MFQFRCFKFKILELLPNVISALNFQKKATIKIIICENGSVKKQIQKNENSL